ncbi:uncharacterized protein A4U43_C05F4860 [Asparagus officinalis]|uniref:J domain-containing protein n=1 Tax=Asparagus officinalis TaxID=4686 RepID=A0A5P1EUV2_ASPOF|nr:dnaJ protein ERDJ3A [Asparagus officinalis]ONK67890.1 uncharacterized protein A4U43_C05F4860 [Asparagus officinalis]
MALMIRRSRLLFLLFFMFLFASREAKTLDPYKVLGVDKNASQREIQKAFHRLSLKYHPDKNKNKGANEKFAEINNAYEILSDEEKKKNYDLYGDEKGNPGFGGGNFGNSGGNFGNGEGYTYFTSGGPGGGGSFTSGPGGWKTMGGQGNTKSFSFSFGGNDGGSGSPFGFDFGDMFNLFGGGMKGGNQQGGFSGGNNFGGFTDSGGTKSGFASSGVVKDINSQFFDKHIKDKGLTWLLLFYTPSARGYHVLESIVEDVANSLQGAVKAGKINCVTEKTLCKDIGVSPSKSANLFIYSFKSGERGTLVEYTGESDARTLKFFVQEHLPRFSKRVDLRQFDFSSSTKENLPQVLLLSTKKDTPVMWRALSGLYHKRFAFYDAEVHHDTSHPMLKRLGVKAFPALVGRLVNGEEHVLKEGISVKDLKSGISELRTLLEDFEKKNKMASSRAKKASKEDSQGNSVSYLTASNMDNVCGDRTAVCIIGIFRSSKVKEKLEATLSEISQKSLVRRHNLGDGSRDSISYCLLDATKHSSFLYSFDKSGYKYLDKLLVAYKPKKRKFAVYTGEVTMEEVEKFVSSVLSGDVRFSNVLQKPVLR